MSRRQGRPDTAGSHVPTAPLDGLDGVPNVRDLAGTATRSGARVGPRRLLRGASLSTATDADVDRLAAAGVDEVVDLRADWELASTGPVPATFVVHHLPLVDDAQRDQSHDVLRRGGLAGYYAWLVDHAAPRLVEVVARIGSARGGVLVQCGAGKDRTGITIALLLDLLDVDDDAIVGDYAATGPALRDLGTALARTPGYERAISDLPREVLRAPATAMATTLARLRATGTIAERLARHGLTDDHVEALRHRLLRPPPG